MSEECRYSHLLMAVLKGNAMAVGRERETHTAKARGLADLGGPLASPVSLSLHAYERIQLAILENRLPPGTPVAEPRLAQEFDISRTVLREALVRLEAEGYLVRGKGGRRRVFRMSRQDAIDIYECRGALEGLAAASAASRAKPRDLRRAGQLLEGCREALTQGALDRVVSCSAEFHDIVIASAANAKLTNLMSVLQPQLRLNRWLMLHHATRDGDYITENSRLLDAIATHQARRAEEQARFSAQQDLKAVLCLFDKGILSETDEITLRL
jgi:DNA-binding GntR family transcriptional regulator